MGFYVKFHSNWQLNEKAKTTNNGSFLKIIRLRPRTFKLDKTLLFVC